MGVDELLQARKTHLFPHLNERQRRLSAAVDAVALGHGGVSRVAAATGLSRTTIYQGIADLEGKFVPVGRSRREGGGRKPLSRNETLLADLDGLIEPKHLGSPLRWTCKSTRALAADLKQLGHAISHETVAVLLAETGYRLRAKHAALEGCKSDSTNLFRRLATSVTAQLRDDLPVISVTVGKIKKGPNDTTFSRAPQATGEGGSSNPENEEASDWHETECDPDTAAFAVGVIGRWWEGMGRLRHPKADKLLICCEGGSRREHLAAWRTELQTFVDGTGVEAAVRHIPPGTYKWEGVEHDLVAHMTVNRQRKALVRHAVTVEYIGSDSARRRRIVSKKGTTPKVNVRPDGKDGGWSYTIARSS